MSGVRKDLLGDVLRYYADLCPAPGHHEGLVACTRADTVLLGPGTHASELLRHPWEFEGGETSLQPAPGLERLAKLDALHADEGLVRHGWVTLAGTINVEGTPRQILQPILSEPVRVRHRPFLQRAARTFASNDVATPFSFEAVGEPEAMSLIDDPGARAQVVDTAEFGRGALQLGGVNEALLRRMPQLTSWIRSSAGAAGLAVGRFLPPGEDPFDWVERQGLVAVVTHSLYLTRATSAPSLRNTLVNWAGRPGTGATAFAHLLATAAGSASIEDRAADAPAGSTAERPNSPMLLSESQAAVVIRSRTAPLTVVSGAPGNGKTHTLCAIALDAVAHGRSVLIATQSRHAAPVVTSLLHRVPGPEPVRFGDGVSMSELIDELAARQERPLPADELRRLERELSLAELESEELRRSIAEDLQRELDAAGAREWQDALPGLMRLAPGAFALDSDLTVLSDLHAAAAAAGDDRGWWARRRARRAQLQLARAVGATGVTDTERIGLAIEAARAGRAAAELSAQGGASYDRRWERLARADRAVRRATGELLRARQYDESSLDDDGRRAVGQLIAALRAGRGRRRELLGELAPGELTRAAPLWVGTLGEIEDVLPAVPALFDLVVLDEASQIEQSRAAPALLRATSAVVVGDPRQLRHVSFRSDEEVLAALVDRGLDDWRALLDTRRVAAFDLAASAGPVDHLREHFRSVPHLIEFSVRRFYRDRVQVMTRHPANEAVDAIGLLRPEGPGDRPGDLAAEVAAVVEAVRALTDQGVSVGVVSPFREHADAIEEALLSAFTAEQIDALQLRAGTVHEFQGGERDVVFCALGLHPDDPPGRRRFAEEPNLFNVMVTRARREVIVVTSLPLATPGLIGDYLRYGEHALAAVGEGPPGEVAPWTAELDAALRRLGTSVRGGYPVGPWRLDLVLGDGPSARALETVVAAAGPAAHIDRHLTLIELGWTLEDAFASRWDGDPVRAAIELADRS